MTKKKIIKVKINQLKPYQHQDEVFRPLAECDLDALAEDMRCNGQIHPVEITKDRVIIDGHQRVAAAKRLGWTEVDVWVRADLDELGIAHRHVEATLNRRQLDPLDLARAAKRLQQIKAKE